MRSINVIVAFGILLSSCGGGGKSQAEKIKEQTMVKMENPADNWKSNHGIGPIKAFELGAEIDEEMALKGKEIYEAKCTACHKVEKRFIGPSPTGILERRTPAWIMNMILNPEEMVQKDPLAKQILIEYNGSPMANQNLTQEEARAVLEYFRTLE